MKRADSKDNTTPSQRITNHIGELGDWRGNMLAWLRQLILDDGRSLGWIEHVLEVHFDTPGTYRYRSLGAPSIRGTIIVSA